MKGYYHSIETFGTVDGKGIRYVLFLTGCALSCRFCHNPDTWEPGGRTVTVDAVLDDYAKYAPYYKASGGGITVSGGEPLLQPGFVAALFAACRRKGIHTTLDTAGFVPAAALEAVLPQADAVLFGLKAVEEATHRRLTGHGNSGILANLHIAADSGCELIVRYIVVPGVNDSEKELKALATLLNSLGQQLKVELLAYHLMGKAKWQQLGKPYELEGVPAADETAMRRAAEILSWQGVRFVR